MVVDKRQSQGHACFTILRQIMEPLFYIERKRHVSEIPGSMALFLFLDTFSGSIASEMAFSVCCGLCN